MPAQKLEEYSMGQVAEILDVSVRLVHGMCKRGLIHYSKDARGHRIFQRAEIERIVSANEHTWARARMEDLDAWNFQ